MSEINERPDEAAGCVMISQVVRDMAQIVADPLSDDDERDAAIATLAEALQPAAAAPRLREMNGALQENDRLRKREAKMLAAGDLLESQLCEAARERDRLRLTDAERAAIKVAIDREVAAHWGTSKNNADVLMSLLERHKGGER